MNALLAFVETTLDFPAKSSSFFAQKQKSSKLVKKEEERKKEMVLHSICGKNSRSAQLRFAPCSQNSFNKKIHRADTAAEGSRGLDERGCENCGK